MSRFRWLGDMRVASALVVRLALFGIVTALAVAMVAPSYAEESWGVKAGASASEVNAAMDTLARIPGLQRGDFNTALTSIGFSADRRPAGWTSLTPVEQVRQAYRYAEADSSNGGINMLVALVHQLEKHYESVAFDPALSPLFMAPPSSVPLHFRAPSASSAKAPLPPELEAVLGRLSIYVGAPGPLSRSAVARRVFGLSGDSLVDVMQPQDTKEFLLKAARQAPVPPPVRERINQLMRDAYRYAEAPAHDAALAAVVLDLNRKFGRPTDVGPLASAMSIDPHGNVAPDSAGGGGGGGGGTPGRMRTSVEAHNGFESAHYSTRGSRGFSAVTGRAGGRGGVVAGAPLAGSDLGKPKTLGFAFPPGQPCAAMDRPALRGDVVVRTDKGEFRYRGARCDVMFAARQLVFDNLGVAGWLPGDALGLASIDLGDSTPTFPLFLPARSDMAQLGKRKRMVLHPALVDLPIGRSATVLDLWPMASSGLLAAVGEDPKVSRWLRTLEKASTWKWVDSPAVIQRRGSDIDVLPRGRATLLAMRTYTNVELAEEEVTCDEASNTRCLQLMTKGTAGRMSDAFDAAAPLLVRRVQEFQDIESLMQVVAIFRWAREMGIRSVDGSVPLAAPAQRARTPASLIIAITGEWIAGDASTPDWTRDCHLFVSRWKVAKARLNAGAPGVQEAMAINYVEQGLQELGVLSDAGSNSPVNCLPPARGR